jgi:hypothetical protein
MATTPTIVDVPPDFSTAQPSDYGSQLIGLQDYAQIPVASNLNAPSLDSPLGVDPFTGYQDTSIPWAPVAPDLLSGQPLDASGGLNAVNPTLLPYLNPSNPTNGVIDPSMIAWTGKGSATDPSVSSGASLEMDGNLPLTTPNMSNTVQLANPNLNPVPLGSSIWAKIFGLGSSVALGAAKGGTAGSPNAPGNTKGTIPGTVKPAPKTAIANPISNTSMFLILGVVSALIGAILWSFSGRQ